ncbi:MAG: class I SAM-dependent methyltransferase [Crocinitomicaceae bacterium]|nr:class I SAM-dependent methyltransferase [Crocinitomicaceae bacterium]
MENITPEKVTEFYDDFVKNQKKVGVSIRHRLIFKKLKSMGLSKNSNVLEIGCGIGTVSSLIINHCSEGQFLGCDISPESIRFANEKYGSKNVKFIVDDMSQFTSSTLFDFVVFPDVLEHIPVEQHSKIFENISKVCKSDAKVLINIPHLNATEWYRKHKPEVLQIIDQELSLQDLLNNVYPHGFYLHSIIPYAIHTHNPCYFSIVLLKNPTYNNMNRTSGFAKLIQNIKSYF